MGLAFNEREPRLAVKIPLLRSDPVLPNGTIENLSSGGLFIRTARLLPVHSAVNFSFPLDNREPLTLFGRITHVRNDAYNEAKGLGVQFLNTSDADFTRLRAYIDRIKHLLLPNLAPVLSPNLTPFKLDLKLLIGGQEIDTGRYGYTLYASKLLDEYAKTQTIAEALKAGHLKPEYTEYVFGRFAVGGSRENQMAMEAAAKASQSYRYFPLSDRRAIIDMAIELFHLYREQVIEIMIAEGHSKDLATWEYDGIFTAYGSDNLDFSQHNLSKKISDGADGEIHIVRRPDGVVALCLPNNAPAINSVAAGFSLLAGNTLVIKPPVQMPLSTLFIWKEIFLRATRAYGAPDGVINVITGNSVAMMEEWIQSPHVNDLFFFGASPLGLSIGAKAYQNGKKPILELSGNDMMIVWKDADIEGAAESLCDGFLASTQICMLPKRALIHEAVFDRFSEVFLARIEKIKPGLPTEGDVFLSPVKNIQKFYEYLNDALAKGAKRLCGGMRLTHRGKRSIRGEFIEPTVLAIENLSIAENMECVWEESFFPLIPLIKVAAPLGAEDPPDSAIFSQMMALLNHNQFGIRTSIWVQSEEYLNRFITCAQNSALLLINTRHVQFSKYLATHGGIRRTGGPFGEMNYVWEKTTHSHGIYIHKNTR